MEKIKNKLVEIKASLLMTSWVEGAKITGLANRVGLIINKYYGAESLFQPKVLRFEKLKSWGNDEYNELISFIDLLIDDIELTDKKGEIILPQIQEQLKQAEIAQEIKTLNTKIFIVHGHNEAMKQSVARVIEKLELEPIILHEKSNQGQTIIEKFMSNSNVGFAIILLSADDIGYSKKDGEKSAKERARQNVVFELGFFTAKLGRKRVIALVEKSETFDFIPFSNSHSNPFRNK